MTKKDGDDDDDNDNEEEEEKEEEEDDDDDDKSWEQEKKKKSNGASKNCWNRRKRKEKEKEAQETDGSRIYWQCTSAFFSFALTHRRTERQQPLENCRAKAFLSFLYTCRVFIHIVKGGRRQAWRADASESVERPFSVQ